MNLHTITICKELKKANASSPALLGNCVFIVPRPMYDESQHHDHIIKISPTQATTLQHCIVCEALIVKT